MRNGRLFLSGCLICLPVLLLIGIGGCFVLVNVPRAERREASRIGLEYRELAEDFIAHPERATYVGERQKGWRQERRKIGDRPWGIESRLDGDDRRVRIWFRAGESEWRAVEVEAIRPFPYRPVFYGGGLLVACSLVWLSTLAVGYFVRYAKSRDDFLAAAAHDLTTPLVGLRMVVGRDDDEARRLVERLLLIVSNIKDFLRLGGHRRSPQMARFDLVALCREAYGLFAADYAESESGEVTFVCEEPVIEVMADEILTLQILWNLFGNDLKYAAPIGKVSVRLARADGFARVEFVDEGQGMSPRQMARAFDRYYRAQTALACGKGGLGIGLCTAREFARAMGGDLSVAANVPKGCRFTLRLKT